ncbi:MAG: fumarylacetoacetate hydrolase family protein [Gorillibacterium sp.]|nr:fumarylacetoacetate hydrolase family protein [Gorillibacterium sp.]
MRIVTIKTAAGERAGIVAPHGIIMIDTINHAEKTNWPTEAFAIIQSGNLDNIRKWYRECDQQRLARLTVLTQEQTIFGPLYRLPRKIWGIGLNYVKDPEELKTISPEEEPVGFLKPDTSLIGPNDAIRIPPQSVRTIAEAELAIVIGKKAKDISPEEAPQYVAGFTTALDMAADDIHQRNLRFLARAKSFDTFFSFGPELITLDEVEDVLALEVSTVLNGEVQHRNVVSNMRFRPWFAVSFHSKVMTLLPGDILITGTPGAVIIRDGDLVECRINGFQTLTNPVERYVPRQIGSE